MVNIKIYSKGQARKEQKKWGRKIIDSWKERWYREQTSCNQPYRHCDNDCFAEWLDMNMEFSIRTGWRDGAGGERNSEGADPQIWICL